MEIQLSRIVDALPGLVWTALPDGHIDFLNQRGANTPASALTNRVVVGGRLRPSGRPA